jgi:hypothetical protein
MNQGGVGWGLGPPLFLWGFQGRRLYREERGLTPKPPSHRELECALGPDNIKAHRRTLFLSELIGGFPFQD